MEPWALPAWQTWTPGQGSDPEGRTLSIADIPAALQGGELKPEESSQPEGAQSPGAMGGTEPEGTKTGLPGLRHQAVSSRPSCPRREDEEVEALPKVRGAGEGWGLRGRASRDALQPGHYMPPHGLHLLS